MEKEPIQKNNALLNIARVLRRNMTRQEKHLWYDFLQHYPVKVYKQRIIDNYVADFYCASARLVIEIDGLQHESAPGRAYDQIRTEVFERYGLYILRFSNQNIEDDFGLVCEKIDQTIRERTGDPP